MHDATAVLLISSHPETVRHVGALLRQTHPKAAHLERAASLAEGFAALRRCPTRTVLVDLALPEGATAVAQLLARAPLAAVIALTQHDDPAEALAAGALEALPAARLDADALGRALRGAAALCAAHARVQDSEAFVRDVLRSLQANAAVLDENGTIVQVNEGWTHFALANDADAAKSGVGVNYFEVCTQAQGDDQRLAQLAINGIRNVMTGKEDRFALHYPCHTPDRQRWFTLQAVPRTSRRGGVIVAHVEVTEQKQAEAELQASQRRYFKLFEESPFGVVQFDAHARVSYVNPTLCNLLGLTAPSTLEKRVIDLIHRDDRGRARHEFRRLLDQEVKVIKFDARMLTDRPQPLWCNLTASLHHEPDGALTCGMLRVDNITERYRQEREREAVLQLSAALRNAVERKAILSILLEQVTQLMEAQSAAVDTLVGPEELFVELGVGIWQPYEGVRFALSEGISGRVIASREPFLDHGGAQFDATPHEMRDIPALPAVACVPLIADGEALGTLWIAREQTISEDSVHMLQALADIGASALRRATLYQQAQRRADQLKAVHSLGRSLAHLLKAEDIYARLVEITTELFDDICAVIVSRYDAQNQTIRCAHGVSDGVAIDAAALPVAPLGTGTQSQTIRQRSAVVVGDLQARYKQSKLAVFVGEPRPHAAVLAPMLCKGEPLGVLQVQSHTPQRFTEADAEFLSILANSAAVALENAQLFEDSRTRIQRLAALRDIELAITTSFDLSVALNVILDNARKQLEVDAACVLVFEPHSQSLRYAAGKGFLTEGVKHSRLRLDQGLAGQAVLQRTLLRQDLLEAENAHWAGHRFFLDEGFTAYCAAPLLAKGKVQGVLEVFGRGPLQDAPEWNSFMEALAIQAAIAIDNATLFDDLQRSNVELTLAYDVTLEGWVKAVDIRDHETEGHTRRVTEMTLRLAQKLGVGQDELAHLRRGALLHDIGKLAIPDAILLKPGPLSDEEWTVMKRHPVYAQEWLAPISFLRRAIDIPYAHHERWDGAGYPRGLKGEAIPLAARIFAVVDVWDALCSNRPYRGAWPKAQVVDHLRTQAGTHFDPEVAAAFLALIEADPA